MSNDHPTITAKSGRQFTASATAVLVFIINEDEQILMLSHPNRDGWEVPNGAYDGGETILDAVLRETREEAGDQIQVRPLSVLHAYTFPYDEMVPYMISIVYLLAYEGGEVVPGDDMAGSQVRWITIEEVERGDINLIAPSQQSWLFQHAVDLYRLLRDKPTVLLQPEYKPDHTNKYGD